MFNVLTLNLRLGTVLKTAIPYAVSELAEMFLEKTENPSTRPPPNSELLTLTLPAL